MRYRCDYCYRFAIAVVDVDPGFWRILLFSTKPRRRYVCAEHIGRAARPSRRRHG
jgi:hypothetical protein